ncbi:alpha/beta hydrolase family protein [Sulfitobacter donghicola]|uniref:alpha/beta hydrolase family protein n=1 Tax=Sulfitobacter donghicola TaxID=421000 RepID=UPI000AD32A75|nr:prolyl oligopeptidase family serine peptidase [Sulfitobacter donghicola]
MKKLLLGGAAVLAIGAGAAMFVTRDTAATHEGLKASSLPPLIPTRAFFAHPNAAQSFSASSDGRLISYLQSSLTGSKTVVKDLTTNKVIAEFPANVQFRRWHPTKPLIRFIFEGHDWEVDPFQPERENWRRTSPNRLSGGWAKNEIATTADQDILTWGKESANDNGHMWLVSQDGLNANKVAEGNAQTLYWVFDETYTSPVLRLDSLDPATTRLFGKQGADWTALIDINVNDQFAPISAGRNDGTILARSSRGRDKVALVSFDTQTGQETVLHENPQTDIGFTTLLSLPNTPDVLRMGVANKDRIALTERGQVFLDILSDFAQPVSLGETVVSASGRYITQAISAQSKPYTFLLIDMEEKSYKILGEAPTARFKEHFVEEQAVTFSARDGLEIPAVLTMPQDVAGPIPFIVYIHGGPAQHAILGYDPETQLWVNRGYGVLSVNFRGSTGFGKEFQSKGFKEFGRAMQDDIADAANWLVSEGLADTDALIAMGTSYGGYSAALAMSRDPGLFDAAIVEFPMLDIEFQSKSYPGFWQSGIHGWWRYFGKVDSADDLELMRMYSPSNRIDELHGPLMILGGLRDQITSVQQVKDFETDAMAAGKDVEVHYFPDAGHGVHLWRDRLRRARLIEEFLAKHAGGRSGGFEFAERAPAFID